VQYIENGAWYGIITAFVIAITGSLGILCFSRIVDNVPIIRDIFKWLGKNSIWILCIHYAVIMLVELKLFNMHVLTNSIMQVVAVSIYGYGRVTDTAKDIIVKILTALFSIGVSAIYALIHSRIKGALKKFKQMPRKTV
jgi:fucose 4-O-acetylase-like acetyltransferase